MNENFSIIYNSVHLIVFYKLSAVGVESVAYVYVGQRDRVTRNMQLI